MTDFDIHNLDCVFVTSYFSVKSPRDLITTTLNDWQYFVDNGRSMVDAEAWLSGLEYE